MFTWRRPAPAAIEKFLSDSRTRALSYGPVGTVQAPASAFQLDELIVNIGHGAADFDAARTALATWTHFRLGWLEVYPRDAPIVTGTVVAVVIRHFGFWSMNGCRVVYGLDDAGGRRFGFAYGTLTNHAERGEELFEVAIDGASGDVTYRIRAASRPRAILVRLGYPLARWLQARCRRESGDAMWQAVAIARRRRGGATG
jgi:uncharacterized protein (UPF0548 family)